MNPHMNEMSSNTLILSESEVQEILSKNCSSVLKRVREAYILHEKGETSLPHSTFLRFPNANKNRIIALPAYIGGKFDIAGLKWIASFPDNLAINLPRASALLILNDIQTGRPISIMSSAAISSQRTAASAALAAHILLGEPMTSVGIVGCGVIGFETIKFLKEIFSSKFSVNLFDLNEIRAHEFRNHITKELNINEVFIHKSFDELYQISNLITFTTTATAPHVITLPNSGSPKVILHLSLRDLDSSIIENSYNVVDDFDHVCRAETSIYLTYKRLGHDRFVNTTLGNILTNPNQESSFPKDKNIIFSPFGLGILDVAVGSFVYEMAVKDNIGLKLVDFCK